MTDLIVPFPRQRQRQCQRNQLKHRKVQFAETAQLHIYEPHNIARRELWFTKTEYYLMKLAVQDDVLKVRAGRTSIDTAASDSNDDAVRVSSGFWIGISHLLTQSCIDQVRTCRARCTQAVLTEQARQGPYGFNKWENIALASLAQTRQPILRARKLAKLHREAI